MKKLSVIMVLAAVSFGILIMSNSKQSTPSEKATDVLVAEPLDGAKPTESPTETTIEIAKEEIPMAEAHEVIEAKAEEPKVNKAPSPKAKSLDLTEKFEARAKALEQNPDNATAHYRYAQVCADLGRYEEAEEALKKAESLGYKNLGNLYYQFGYIAMARNEGIDSKAYNYFGKAKEHGFRNYRKFLYSPAFVTLQKDSQWEFMNIYQELFSKNKKAMFKAFLLLGPRKKDNIAYELTTKRLLSNYTKEEWKTHPRISGYFDDFVEGVGEGMFSRGGGNDFRYEIVAQYTKNFITVIYSNEVPWADYLTPRSYHLVTLDLEGNKIDELEIAERRKLNRCKTVTIAQDQTIAITEHKVRWKSGWKDQDELTFEQVKYTKELATSHYMIAANGKIVETDPISVGMID